MSIGTDKRDRFRALAHRIRAIPGRDFGLRPYRVYVVTAHFPNTTTGHKLTSNPFADRVELTHADGQPPKVRWLNEEELAVGNYSAGTVEIGPITPSLGGGTPIELLKRCVNEGDLYHLELVGPQFPNGARFAQQKLTTDHALHYIITASRVAGDAL